MSSKKELKEKKLMFSPAVAPMVDAVLAKVAEHENAEIWRFIVFDNDAKQVNLTVSRANTRTNAYPKKATAEQPKSRSAKSATAHFYTMELTSILWNNSARLFLIGTERVWRVESASAPPAELDELEMAMLRQCVDDALMGKIVKCEPFQVRAAKPSAASATTATAPDDSSSDEDDEKDEDDDDEEDDEEEDEPSWLENEEEGAEEEGEEPPCKRQRVDDGMLEVLRAMKESFDANTAVQREIATLLEAQTALLTRVHEFTASSVGDASRPRTS